MAKNTEKSSWIRIVLTGIIWSFVYLQGMALLCYNIFRFNPLILSEWITLVKRFMAGQWVINTVKDTGLFVCLILFVPLWGIGWYVLTRVRWGRYLPSFKSRRTVQRRILGDVQAKKPFAPMKLRVQSSALLSVNPAAAYSQQVGGGTKTNVGGASPAAVSSYPDEADIQQMLPLVQSPSVDFFPHISLNGHYAAFALSTENKAAVVTLINDPEGRWSVDTESPVENSDWYSETRILPAPLSDIIQIAEQLRQSDSGAMAVPVAVLMSGTMLNAVEAKTYLEEKGIVLTRLEAVDSDDIPLFSDFMTFFFESTAETKAISTEAGDEALPADEVISDTKDENGGVVDVADDEDEGVAEPEDNV